MKRTNQKYTIDEVRGIISSMKGELLTNKYVDNKQVLSVKCLKCRAIWNPRLHDILRGYWCPSCAGVKRLTISDAHLEAEKNGGKCISKKYINNRTKMKWQCKHGHIWEAKLNHIRNHNSWCPECKRRNKSQRILQGIIEAIFCNYTVESNFTEFGWLYNPKTKRKQEIDIWVPNIKLAIEYDGEQHFVPMRFGTKSEMMKRLDRIRARDKRKNLLMKRHKNDVNHFIRINYTERLTYENIKNILIERGVLIEE